MKIRFLARISKLEQCETIVDRQHKHPKLLTLLQLKRDLYRHSKGEWLASNGIGILLIM